MENPMKMVNRAALTSAGQTAPHKELDTSEVYDKLRQAHQCIKDIYYSEGYDERFEGTQKDAIEAVNSVLYLAEGLFTDF